MMGIHVLIFDRGGGITFILMSYYRLLTALLSHAISCAFLLAQWVLQVVLFRRDTPVNLVKRTVLSIRPQSVAQSVEMFLKIVRSLYA